MTQTKLWVRHATQERAERAVAFLTAKYGDFFAIVESDLVPSARFCVVSIPEDEKPCEPCANTKPLFGGAVTPINDKRANTYSGS